ncbi:MAG: class I SAM-dependent methyltransferase [Candidatus Gracilibacteria bacterium]
MENVNSGLVDLDWRERGNYPALDGVYKKMTFEDASNLVFSSDKISVSRSRIGGLMGVDDEDSSLISERAGAWDAAMSGLLTDDFPLQSGDMCTQLSRDLGVVSDLEAAKVNRELSDVVSKDPEELSRLYHATILLVLLGERVEFGRVPYVEPRTGPKLPDDLRQKLSGILSGPPILGNEGGIGSVDEVDMRNILFLNHEVLQRYRKHFFEVEKYPVERALQQDPERISEYCYALLRLVLGKSENFSEVLQESFVSEEVTNLSRRYFPQRCGGRSLWDAEISDIVGQLRDLGARAFEHNCLMTCRVPTSGVITPPGRLVEPDANTAVDFGAGLYARFLNAMARGNPGCHFHAVDKKVREECDLRLYNSPNMHFLPGDFDDKSSVDRLVARFGGTVDMINLSNILHKLRDPAGFLRVVFGRMLKRYGGKVNVCMPAISGFVDKSGRRVGARSLVAMGYEDTTHFWESFLTIETFLEVVRSISNLKITSIAFADSRLSENDMTKRMFVALERNG